MSCSRLSDSISPICIWVFCRIDYHLATPALAARARSAAIHKEPRLSDHAPLTLDYDFVM